MLEYELAGADFNEQLSSSLRNKSFSQSFQLGFKQVRKEYNLDAGLQLNSSMLQSDDILDAARNVPQR